MLPQVVAPAYVEVRNLSTKHNLRAIGCSSNLGILELLVQATSNARSWLFKQLRDFGVGCSSNSARAPRARPPGRFVDTSGAL
eukprot:2241176-Alexandrium_andersonii.AAC.1